MKIEIIKYTRVDEDGNVIHLECIVYWKRRKSGRTN